MRSLIPRISFFSTTLEERPRATLIGAYRPTGLMSSLVSVGMAFVGVAWLRESDIWKKHKVLLAWFFLGGRTRCQLPICSTQTTLPTGGPKSGIRKEARTTIHSVYHARPAPVLIRAYVSFFNVTPMSDSLWVAFGSLLQQKGPYTYHPIGQYQLGHVFGTSPCAVPLLISVTGV